MIILKTRDDRRETVERTRRNHCFPTEVWPNIERVSTKRTALFRRQRHLMKIAVATQTLRRVAHGERLRAFVLSMTSGAGTRVDNVRLMESVSGVTLLASCIDTVVAQF